MRVLYSSGFAPLATHEDECNKKVESAEIF
jgi:hypothetical protein